MEMGKRIEGENEATEQGPSSSSYTVEEKGVTRQPQDKTTLHKDNMTLHNTRK